MTQEEKARAYDEALERAKNFIENGDEGEKTVAKSIFAGLIDSESEDERIRKTLIEALKTSKTVGELKFIFPESTREECIAYLEKQGEQKVSVDDFKAKDWYVSKVDGKIHNIYYSVDKVKPKFKVGDKIIEKDFDKCGRGTIIDIKDGKYIFDDGGFICIEEQGLWKLVEQKPAWSEEDERIRKALINYFKAHNALVGENWNGIECDNVIAYLEKQKEQKPADDRTFEFEKAKAEYEGIVEGKQTVLDHPEEYGLQKPAEWSEEDEYMLKEIIAFFKDGTVKLQHDLDLYAGWLANRLKSLRPSWKPSKKEIDAFENLLKGEFSNKIFPGATLANLLNKLKKLYYNEAIQVWKPSEEQMEALKCAVNDSIMMYDHYGSSLKEEVTRTYSENLQLLYEQLKKLM